MCIFVFSITGLRARANPRRGRSFYSEVEKPNRFDVPDQSMRNSLLGSHQCTRHATFDHKCSTSNCALFPCVRIFANETAILEVSGIQ